MSSLLFTPIQLGPLVLKNRSIRAAAFEGMCPSHSISKALIDYHLAVARGGVAMTTIAYAAVDKTGLSFPHQLLMQESMQSDLKKMAEVIHRENTALSIQLGHCGDMAKHGLIGQRPWSASSHLNLYAPCFAKEMKESDMQHVAKNFVKATQIAINSGLDAIEIHAGHGYLISQFLSPYTNQRQDAYGGTLENRMRFMSMVMSAILAVAKNKIAVLVKLNMRDGFDAGMPIEESIQVSKRLESLGVDALVLSGGFVSKAPMYVMRGKMPIKTLAARMDNKMMEVFTKLFGKQLVPDVPFTENYFLSDALRFRAALTLPLIYVGGILSQQNIDEVLDNGMDAVAIARALIRNPNFINELKKDASFKVSCDTCNHCMAVMYNGPFECNKTGGYHG